MRKKEIFSKGWIEKNRFHLLILATVMVLVLPAFAGSGMLSEILFVVTMTFLFIQSMLAANPGGRRKWWLRGVIILLTIVVWLQPVGVESFQIDILKLIMIAAFFVFVLFHLFRFIVSSRAVNLDVLIASANIFLLLGIVWASLSFLFSKIYPGSYNLPPGINEPGFVTFLYYSFITLTTVGYGDITPLIPQTQTLAYFISVTGQLYVAIIIAFLVGKFLVNAGNTKR